MEPKFGANELVAKYSCKICVVIKCSHKKSLMTTIYVIKNRVLVTKFETQLKQLSLKVIFLVVLYAPKNMIIINDYKMTIISNTIKRDSQGFKMVF